MIIEIFEGVRKKGGILLPSNRWHYRIKAKHLTSKGYTRKSSAKRAAKKLIQDVAYARIIEV